jgi:hypothetical protein
MESNIANFALIASLLFLLQYDSDDSRINSMCTTPRLIRCHLPAHLAGAPATATWRVIQAGRLNRKSNTPLPAQIQNVFAVAPKTWASSNNNQDLRAYPRIEISLYWGEIDPALKSHLHQFLSNYAKDNALLARNGSSCFLIKADEVAAFHRMFVRIKARRPWLKAQLSGPWPPFSFPSSWMEDVV